MEKINKYCLLFVVLILMFFIGYQCGINTNKSQDTDSILIQDTTYNRIILDSIQYNIIKKDSIIYSLKQKMKDEIEESNNLSDTATVDLFQWLATSPDDFPCFTGE